MAAVETDKRVYIFYQAPYQSSVDYLEVFKGNFKVSKAHNGAVGYHIVLSLIALQ